MTKRWKNQPGEIVLSDWSIEMVAGNFKFMDMVGTEIECLASIAEVYGLSLRDELLEIKLEFLSSGSFTPSSYGDPEEYDDDREVIAASILTPRGIIKLAEPLVKKLAELFEEQVYDAALSPMKV